MVDRSWCARGAPWWRACAGVVVPGQVLVTVWPDGAEARCDDRERTVGLVVAGEV